MKQIFKVSISIFSIYSLLFITSPLTVLAADNKYDLNYLTLPSEVESMPKRSGSVYYDVSVKGKVLIPVHFWGEVKLSGLHFIPMDTNLVNGLSMAGGPTSLGVIEDVRVTKKTNKGGLTELKFNLESGGTDKAHKYVLSPGDTVFIKKSNYYQDRSYYTSLISVIATFLSTILLYREVRR